ncbi:hypothetical protein L1887_13874 [Cichorium endivia]|nr:hypothetical protein L1887_13874 [Cichorium endivia]
MHSSASSRFYLMAGTRVYRQTDTSPPPGTIPSLMVVDVAWIIRFISGRLKLALRNSNDLGIQDLNIG